MIWPFRRKKKQKPPKDSIVREKWETKFFKQSEPRFQETRQEGYSASIDKQGLHFSLEKKDFFAWLENDYYRYRDFVLEGDFSFSPKNGDSSAGFMFRYVNEFNYYYCLVSTDGMFRFDLVFNGTPMVRVPWTRLPVPINRDFTLRVLARDTRFTFFVDAEWVAEIEDEGIDAGYITLCGQNYSEQKSCEITISRLSVESRPIKVEQENQRFNDYLLPQPESRIQLAQSFFRTGQFSASLVQMKKALRTKSPEKEDFVFLAEILFHLNMFSEAEETCEKCLSEYPDTREAVLLYAESLYMQNRYLKLRDFMLEKIELIPESSAAHNLLGNAYFGIGEWEESIKWYVKAFEIEPDMPIFMINAASAAEKAGKKELALTYYTDASRLLFRQEAYADLEDITVRINALGVESPEVNAFQGKKLFHEKKYREAENIFTRLIEQGYSDSAVYYLQGVLLKEAGNRGKAQELFLKAAEIEPEYPLYWFRLAENAFLQGKSFSDYLEKAAELSPEDPWVLNLQAERAFLEGDTEQALEYMEKAFALEPYDQIILGNYVEALYRSGYKDKAFAVLDSSQEMQESWNRRGTLLSREGRIQEAAQAYEKAIRIGPERPEILENAAAVYIELDRFSVAEEYLSKVLEMTQSVSVYNRIGNLALLKGERSRALVAYKKALELDPENREALLNIAAYYYDVRNFKEARPFAEKAGELYNDQKAQHLLQRIVSNLEVAYSCDLCNNTWTAPKEIPSQPNFRVHGEPPEDAPAGKCPSCGKVYCIKCASGYLHDKRFVCPDCREKLSFSDEHLKYILMGLIGKSST
ncbi:MAG: tetratricopeptide repeat protein [Spirochaetia bacterium]